MSRATNLEHLSALHLSHAKAQYRAQFEDPSMTELDFDERLCRILDYEIAMRANARVQRRTREAGFSMRAAPEDFELSEGRGLTRERYRSLVSLSWLSSHHHLAITGPTGVGKTYLGIALGVSAIRAGYLVRYYKLSKLLEKVGIARADGTYPSFAAALARTHLLVLDDWGISPISPLGSREILDLLDDRGENGSLIISSQLPVSAWYESLGERTVADAIMDRIVHNAIPVELKGESMRKQRSQRKEENGPTEPGPELE
ncbi:IS21-like element helper ATPase IstB [Ferrimicrobium sp.]|uniref:IS21-like element helper ATPase IstB n=1 Tax=Ferrimicrobium sp. TaxID=2926050 RepID=UPI002617650C|nr:IS21-like element helper ATPase IstB [Ferrimicrobium sp.]